MTDKRIIFYRVYFFINLLNYFEIHLASKNNYSNYELRIFWIKNDEKVLDLYGSRRNVFQQHI